MGYNWMLCDLPRHSQHHKSLQARFLCSHSNFQTTLYEICKPASSFPLHPIELSCPEYKKPVSMSLPYKLQQSTLLGRCWGWSLLLVTTSRVYDLSLAIHADIPVQTRLLNFFFYLKWYISDKHDYKRLYTTKYSAYQKLILMSIDQILLLALGNRRMI